MGLKLLFFVLCVVFSSASVVVENGGYKCAFKDQTAAVITDSSIQILSAGTQDTPQKCFDTCMQRRKTIKEINQVTYHSEANYCQCVKAGLGLKSVKPTTTKTCDILENIPGLSVNWYFCDYNSGSNVNLGSGGTSSYIARTKTRLFCKLRCLERKDQFYEKVGKNLTGMKYVAASKRCYCILGPFTIKNKPGNGIQTCKFNWKPRARKCNITTIDYYGRQVKRCLGYTPVDAQGKAETVKVDPTYTLALPPGLKIVTTPAPPTTTAAPVQTTTTTTAAPVTTTTTTTTTTAPVPTTTTTTVAPVTTTTTTTVAPVQTTTTTTAAPVTTTTTTTTTVPVPTTTTTTAAPVPTMTPQPTVPVIAMTTQESTTEQAVTNPPAVTTHPPPTINNEKPLISKSEDYKCQFSKKTRSSGGHRLNVGKFPDGQSCFQKCAKMKEDGDQSINQVTYRKWSTECFCYQNSPDLKTANYAKTEACDLVENISGIEPVWFKCVFKKETNILDGPDVFLIGTQSTRLHCKLACLERRHSFYKTKKLSGVKYVWGSKKCFCVIGQYPSVVHKVGIQTCQFDMENPIDRKCNKTTITYRSEKIERCLGVTPQDNSETSEETLKPDPSYIPPKATQIPNVDSTDPVIPKIEAETVPPKIAQQSNNETGNSTATPFAKSAGGITLFSLLGVSGFSGLLLVAKKLLMGEGLGLNCGEGIETTLECGKCCSCCCGDKEENEEDSETIRLTETNGKNDDTETSHKDS
uniref:Cnidarian restricted protein n=1 Tax=Clytia hemisphaerica TaxID=252671 RepID=A0A7M5X1A4_9CNID